MDQITKTRTALGPTYTQCHLCVKPAAPIMHYLRELIA